MNTPQTAARFLTCTQCAALFCVSRPTIARWLIDGTLPSIKIGGRRLIKTETVESMIAEASVAAQVVAL